ncbi:hypothetical protein [Candidatus Tisiphia endosymbiont of Hybos culiciformis]
MSSLLQCGSYPRLRGDDKGAVCIRLFKAEECIIWKRLLIT